MIANHGQEGKHNHIIEGRNSRLDAMQASILNVKLPYLKGWITRRNDIGNKYVKEISNVRLSTPIIGNNEFHAFHLFVIRSNERDKLMAYLKENGIGTSIHYPKALPFIECYSRFNHEEIDFPIASQYQNEILSIPMFPELTDSEIDKIIRVINEF